MNSKTLIWIGLFLGSSIGSFLPTLWGAGYFSLWSTIFTALGSFAGIWVGYQLGR